MNTPEIHPAANNPAAKPISHIKGWRRKIRHRRIGNPEVPTMHVVLIRALTTTIVVIALAWLALAAVAMLTNTTDALPVIGETLINIIKSIKST